MLSSIAVLSIGITLELLKLRGEEGSKKEIEISSVLHRALRLARENRKPVLLLYHNPWTDAVAGQTEALDTLKEILASKTQLRIVTTLKHLGSTRITLKERG